MTHTPTLSLPSIRLAGTAALALAAAFAAPGAFAQAWPAGKPVTLVVGTPPGGSVDVYGRTLAEQLAKQTGGTFIVENKAGANGNLSAEYVNGAAADGHTLWISTQAMFTINPSVYTKLRWKQSDFKPIAKGIESPLVLVTHPSVPAKTLPELAKWAAANPDKAAYASFSPGTPSHFLGFQFNERMKLNMVHVPYKGSAPQIADLLGGQVLLGFTQLQAALPQVKAGKLNAIAVTSKERTKFLPDVPTLAELGHPDLSSTIWFGLVAPSATPKAVLDQIQAAVVRAQASAELKAKLEPQGFDVPQENGDAFAATIAAETARWAQVVKATGFRANE
ncbi:Bug family tripartite tricarboxylate transporter substrate binding protein [Hydrogenophaga sp.]|uniref:Bug family tripartite tricarboxylate transporter substrate binding protein n=1 Tax=Hydrogenophaga sp. TaxID=1904254 RepID=UPI003D0DE7DB